MNQKQRIDALERRVRELEARPVYVPIYVGQPLPAVPIPSLPWPPSPYPWQPSPIWGTSSGEMGCVYSSEQ